jgi:phosphonate transport system permease protein
MIESIQIAILATFVGVFLSLPMGLAAARNLSPAWVSWTARAVIAVLRSFHPVIVAILFVKAVGFGALAGILALIVSTIGFVSKLFAEVVEEISAKQVEAVRATGASFFAVLIFGVFPQVMARFVGLTVYQFDSNLRNSTMVGIVGGGGIGAPLFTAYQRFDYDVVLTILLIIITLIMIAEFVSARIRRIFQ